ncbi:MAG TPA: AAA family ATPase [Anaerolineae bacterium]|nr:AAA family ATPase [Anaerolineae bacterium]HQK13305.1 AAA family ATPase [Anaerolineae bacterium]
MYITQVKLHSEYYPTDRYYPFNIPTLRRTRVLTFKKPVAFFVGENGSGKSTLLEALTRKCGVHIWDTPKRRSGYDNPYADRLVDFIDVTWANGHVPGSLFRAETFREMAEFFDDAALSDPGRLAYQGGQLLNTLSHGEGMLAYFKGRYHVKGLYFLDEPEAALSPTSQIKFLKLLQLLVAGGQTQFIIATHSPILLAYPDAQIFSFDEGHIEEVTYEETAHYRIYKQFFTDRDVYLTSNQ